MSAKVGIKLGKPTPPSHAVPARNLEFTNHHDIGTHLTWGKIIIQRWISTPHLTMKFIKLPMLTPGSIKGEKEKEQASKGIDLLLDT